MNTKVLKILADNARCPIEDIAVMSGLTISEVESEIKELESVGFIKGYKTVINWEKIDDSTVSALIELKVIPQAELGFEGIAETIMKYKEVETVYLMSGSYDLTVIVKGKTFQEVARFVAKELATVLKGGVEANFTKKIAGGFTIGPKDGGYFISFTEETFNALISEYLRPATKKILFG